MGEKTKGVTIPLNTDVSGVRKAFKELTSDSWEVDRSLREVQKALKLDPGNVTLLESKQKLLSSAVEKTASQLEIARKAQEDFIASGGDINSAEYIQMQIETEKLASKLSNLQGQSAEVESALNGTADAAEDAGEAAEDLAEGAEQASDSFGAWEVAVGNLLSNGLQKLTATITDAITSTFALADDLATLANNYSITQEAAYALSQYQGLLDYSMQNVAKMIKEQTGDLAKGTEAYDMYGIAVKDVSGNLLSSERIFINTVARLREIDDPVQRAAAGVELLGQKYYDLGGIMNSSDADFAEFSAAVLDSNQALQEDIAGLNKWNDMIDRAKMALTDIAISLGDTFGWLADIEGLLPAILIMVGSLTAAWLATGGALKIATAAQTLLNSAMLANPIGIIIIAVGALIGIIYLLVQNIDSIKTAFAEAAEGARLYLQDIKEWASGIIQNVKDAVNNAMEQAKAFFEAFKDAVKRMLDTMINALLATWDKITGFLDSAKEAGARAVDGLLNGIRNAWNKLVSWVEAAWQRLVSIFTLDFSGIGGGTIRVNGSHASGLDYVPFDGYIAELHKGERVLTAQEARSYDNGGSTGGVTQTNVNVQFSGSLAQLASVLQPVITAETRRIGGSLAAR